jgi:hypothetical protein
MELSAGSRWNSRVCDTQVVVVRPPDATKVRGCGGAEMIPLDSDEPRGQLDPSLAGGTQLGKRYADDSSGIEVLCTKAGEGTLTLDGERLEIKGAKPLPSSD